MAICELHKKCSGCQLQNLTYEEQLSLKQATIIKLIGKFCHVDEIIPMENPTHYRNKLQCAFAQKSGKVTSGIYRSSTRSILPVDSCMLDNPVCDNIVLTIRKMCSNFKLKPYDLNTGKGFIRHVLIRNGHYSDKIMVVIVTAKGEFSSKRQFVNELLRRHPEITTVVWNINPTGTPLFLGEYSEILYGDGYITDYLCSLNFRISPRSFYQINTVQTEKLYSLAREYAGLASKERVLDAYCGTGTIGLILSQNAREVVGVEVNADAVEDAKSNAKLNGIKNAKFICADASDFMVKCASKGEKFDVVVVDPPRAGCSKKFLESLVKLSPEKIVYVSCNPETLARDLSFLVKNSYKVKKARPVDMFPFTSHVESVVCLTHTFNN